MKYRDVFALQNALNQLDAVSLTTNAPVFVFKGSVRLSLTTKMRALRDAAADYAATRKKLEAEMKVTSKTSKEDPELWAKFDAALGDMLDADAEIALGAKIRMTDFDLDANPLTSGLIIALSPIIIDPP